MQDSRLCSTQVVANQPAEDVLFRTGILIDYPGNDPVEVVN